MEQKTEKLGGIEKFKQSKEYLSLEKEVKESVAQALASEEGEDIEPVMRLFDQQMAKHQSNAVLREKLFWETVGDVLKKEVFGGIYQKIAPLIEVGGYSEIEPLLNKELSLVIQKLSPTIYRNLDKRGFALTVLKNQFLSLVPEVSALVRGEAEGRKPKSKIPAGKFVEREEHDLIDKVLESWMEQFDKERPPQHPIYAKEKTWPAPELSEIIPGLIIEWESIEFDNHGGTFEVLEPPYQDDIGWWVKARIISGFGAGQIEKVSLEDRGILPYKPGQWNNWNKPTKWYMKKEGQKP